MCGIAGFISDRVAVTPQILRAMTDRIVPRGPDSSGEWVSSAGTIGFGHRRLAIIDLTEAGHQPMHSACGRYTLTYNGEIYNFQSLRAELEAQGKVPQWRGHSDSEVLLAAISAWGIEKALEKAQGMFAIGLADGETRELVLARDRFGEKPLYYGWTQSGFAFASSLGPIRAAPGFANPVSRPALACLMARAYVPAPLSIHERIFKLPPGCLLRVSEDLARTPQDTPPQVHSWFDYADQVIAGAADPIADEAEALEAIDAVLTGAVSRQLVADVPVGNFLSGGIDSSLVTAIAQKCVSRPIKTFTIGFSEAGFDEAVFAKRVAGALGTDHTELYVSPQDALDVIPRLPEIYDEPFADSSQIPTHLVSRLARSQVTVSLSGDAGDELFGGYNRHVQFPRLWRTMQKVPGPLRRAALEGAGAMPAGLWNGLSDLARRRRSAWFGDNARRALKLMARARNFDHLFDSFMDDWALTGSPLAGSVGCSSRLHLDPRLAHLPLEVRMMHADAMTYLPDDILCKVDRAGMAVSLESRIPFLDPEVTALAARISPSLKFAQGGGKAILKKLLYRYVPRELIDRPKAGFAIPVGVWVKGPLREWAEDLLSERALAEDGLFDARTVRARWQSHLDGREEATQPLWSVLMFQAWKRAASA
ncbi:asparagine synthase (glutamine-hydrolyzing) [Novosphingobium sp. TH158]|uniref:asparagine synthase (glutamine-hydrolyzing) n=1 Tax=Novosphingobium sp. TH158 TaxID=2067455 RepID=UPI000C7C15B6|nr:asparagine synthase (glutamine-hydrolyzing) [Novosphingobium sp. TH158]PLK27908.1 asparagine synthase (glutamine-hydrolyzing) [Novosphingobium sp. TH158]